METVVTMLQSYAGREKFMRTAHFSAMMLSGTAAGRAAQNWGAVARQLGAARVMLRWFDDLPMLATTKTYGLGEHEPDPVLRVLGILGNVLGQIYFPIEHTAWLCDNKILPFNSSRLWTAGVASWAGGLLVTILKSLRNIGKIRHKRHSLMKQRRLESPDKSDAAEKDFKQELASLNWNEFNETLNILRAGSDLLNAVNWLPKGFLWAGKFSLAQQGLFGTVSSVIGLYQLASAVKK